jgi:hypothetical protein
MFLYHSSTEKSFTNAFLTMIQSIDLSTLLFRVLLKNLFLLLRLLLLLKWVVVDSEGHPFSEGQMLGGETPILTSSYLA